MSNFCEWAVPVLLCPLGEFSLWNPSIINGETQKNLTLKISDIEKIFWDRSLLWLQCHHASLECPNQVIYFLELRKKSVLFCPVFLAPMLLSEMSITALQKFPNGHMRENAGFVQGMRSWLTSLHGNSEVLMWTERTQPSTPWTKKIALE